MRTTIVPAKVALTNNHLVNSLSSAAKNKLIRCLVCPKSTIAVIVVTGVSAATETLVVFLSTGTASIRNADPHDMKLPFVFALT
jgi:hypothetical protein